MKYFILLVAVLSVFHGLVAAEDNLERRETEAEIEKRCHGEWHRALLKKRSLGDIADLSVMLKRCLIGGGSGKLEKRDSEVKVKKRCAGWIETHIQGGKPCYE